MSAAFKKGFRYFPIIIAIASAIFVYWLLNIYGKAEMRRNTRASEEILHRELDQNRSAIEQAITGKRDVVKNLAEYVEYNPDIDQEIFSGWAKNIFINSSKQSLTFAITKKDQVNFNYPKSSENKIRLQLKVPEVKKYQYETDSVPKVITYFQSDLLNGKPAIVFQNFIYVADSLTKTSRYWGSAVIVDDLSEVIDQIPFKNNDSRNFNFTLTSKESGEKLRIGASFEKDQLVVTESFDFQTLKVNLYLGNEELTDVLDRKTDHLRILFICIALIIAFFNSYLITNMITMLRTNKILALKNKQIKAQLSEKVLLIKEIHHRIKNHFQLISSLNRTSTERMKNKSVEEIIEEINNRISLMARAYDQINNKSNASNYMPEYVRSVVDSMIYSITPEIEVMYKIAKVHVNIKKTVYIGILLNELVINSIKHGFAEMEENRIIKVKFKSEGSNYILSYTSNGMSLPENILTAKKDSTGMQILSLFTQQLNGSISQISQGDYYGFRIVFPT